MTTCELKSKVNPNFLPNSAQRCRVFDNSIPGNYRVIIGYLAQHKFQLCCFLLCSATVCFGYSIGIIFETAKWGGGGSFSQVTPSIKNGAKFGSNENVYCKF